MNGERKILEIKSEDDRSTVAKILVENGYTVRKASVAKSVNSSSKKTVLQYWKEE